MAPDIPPRWLSLPDAALRLAMPYAEAWSSCLAGRLGPVERRGSRYFLLESAVAKLAAERQDRERR